MTATVIDGKAFAATVREQIVGHVATLKTDHGITPGLAVILVGEDPRIRSVCGRQAPPDGRGGHGIV